MWHVCCGSVKIVMLGEEKLGGVFSLNWPNRSTVSRALLCFGIFSAMYSNEIKKTDPPPLSINPTAISKSTNPRRKNSQKKLPYLSVERAPTHTHTVPRIGLHNWFGPFILKRRSSMIMSFRTKGGGWLEEE